MTFIFSLKYVPGKLNINLFIANMIKFQTFFFTNFAVTFYRFNNYSGHFPVFIFIGQVDNR